MIYCIKCGQEMPDEALFCPSCGTPIATTKKGTTKAKKETIPIASGGTMLNANKAYGAVDLQRLPEGYMIDERYKIIRKLGQGSFGAVYLAYDRQMEIQKALKIIPEAISNDKETMMSLRKEAGIMVKLNHPNIVRVYDFHYNSDIKYIDMEYLEGKSLSELKLEKPEKKFTEKEVKQYALQIAEGLRYAHNKKVIHKDIKPQNILLTKEGEIKLMDFGIAETVHSSMSRLKNTGSSGTLVYMSPEQLEGKDVGKEADIYSLGATLYELLSGHPPFYQGDITYQIINKKPQPVAGASQKMNNLVMKCLEKDRTKRFGNCEAFTEVLKNIRHETVENVNVGTKVNLLPEIAQIINDDFIEMVFVEGSTFLMGKRNKGWLVDNRPQHSVTVDDFYMGKYEVTQKQWKAIMGNNPSDFKGDDLPVETVTWNDIQKFIKKLNRITGKHYRLPTEAEWEYAARGGVETIHESSQHRYVGSNNIDEVAWYSGNSGNKAHPVGTKQPNELGLYDMSGNVWEWCNDWYKRKYYRVSPQNNPQGPASGTKRVLRGGSWYYVAVGCRVAGRNWVNPDYASIGNGFRIVR